MLRLRDLLNFSLPAALPNEESFTPLLTFDTWSCRLLPLNIVPKRRMRRQARSLCINSGAKKIPENPSASFSPRAPSSKPGVRTMRKPTVPTNPSTKISFAPPKKIVSLSITNKSSFFYNRRQSNQSPSNRQIIHLQNQPYFFLHTGILHLYSSETTFSIQHLIPQRLTGLSLIKTI